MTYTRIFIVLESESHGSSENWEGISRKPREFKRFFRPKTGDLKKKNTKKKGLQRNFGQNRKLIRFFPPKKQVVSKNKKVFTEIKTDFPAKIGNSNTFSGRITTFTSQLRHPISYGGGGCFQFFTKNRPQKHQKTCDFAYFTSQWEGSSPPPPPPPPQATLLTDIKKHLGP